MGMIKNILFKIKCSRNPIKMARKIGVKVGEQCSFVSMPNFGSEPYLVEIGNHVRIASGVTFLTHDGATWVFREQEAYKRVIRFGRIVVGNNCFIGYHSIIMPNVKIGDNCIIAAGAIVTKDVPEGSVVGGVPARVITTVKEYADKCMVETPDYDDKLLKYNKRKELERLYVEQGETNDSKI